LSHFSQPFGQKGNFIRMETPYVVEENIQFQILAKKINQLEKNGLYLLAGPTGDGKTYTAAEMMDALVFPEYQTLKEREILRKMKNPPKRMFYAVGRNENLREIEKEFYDNILKERGCSKEEFDRHFLRVYANGSLEQCRNITENCPADWMKKIKKEKQEAIWKYYNYMDGRIKASAKNPDNDWIIAESLKKGYIEAERQLRQVIKTELMKKLQGKTPKERLAWVKQDKKWNWLIKAYPNILLLDSEKTLVALTVSRMYFSFDPILSGTFTLNNWEGMKGSLVFIDEFDASKPILLNHMIDNARTVNLISAYQRLRLALQEFNIVGSEILRPETKNEQESSRHLFDEIKAIFRQGEDQFEHVRLNANFKSAFDMKEYNLLFCKTGKDLVPISKQDKLTVRYDGQTRTNRIFKSQNGEEIEGDDFQNILRYMDGIIERFAYFGMKIASNYKKYRMETSLDYTMDNAINSLLFELKFSKEEGNARFLHAMITNMVGRRPYSGDPSIMTTEPVRGLSYACLMGDPDHSTMDEVFYCKMDETPERYLLELTKQAVVIGISATAQFESVFTNYDLEFIKDSIDSQFLENTKEETGFLKKAYDQKMEGLKTITNDKVLIPSMTSKSFNEMSVRELESYFHVDDTEHREEILEELKNRIMNDGEGGYEQMVICQLIWTAYDFLKAGDMQSLLILTNRNGDRYTDSLRECLGILMGDADCCEIQHLKADNMETGRSEIDKFSVSGRPFIVIMSNNSGGRGLNLKHLAMDGQKDFLGRPLHHIFAYKDKVGRNKDFDAVCIMDLTHVYKNLGEVTFNPENHESLLGYLYQASLLHAHNEISRINRDILIQSAMAKAQGNEVQIAKSNGIIKKTSSYAWAVSAETAQYLGRSMRTGWRNEHTKIYMGERNANTMRYDVNGKIIVSKEYAHYASRRPNDLTNEKLEHDEHKTSRKTEAFYRYLWDNYLRLIGTEAMTKQKRGEWQAIRQMIVRQTRPDAPSLQNDFQKGIMKLACFENPRYVEGMPVRYWFNRGYDFRENTHFDFLRRTDICAEEISDETLMIPQLLKIHGFREYLEQRGIPTELRRQSLQLNPCAAKNIYQGAMGEIAGRYILEVFYGIQVREIDDDIKFEVFDFIAGSDAFLDMKLWRTFNRNEEEVRKQYYDKMALCNAKSGFVINVLPYKGEAMNVSESLAPDGGHLYEVNGLINPETGVINQKFYEKVIAKGVIR